jgi:hypothetical protein
LETDVFVISEWGPVGYVLKSSLALKNLSRLSDDHFFEQKNWFKKSEIIVLSFSSIQMIQKPHLELSYARFRFCFVSYCLRHNRFSLRHNRLSWSI